MSWSSKNPLQTLGFVLIILGILLILNSLIGFTQITYQCPVSGCPPSSLWSVPLYGDSFFFGLVLVIIGIVLLIAARRMKPEQEIDPQSHHEGKTGQSEF